MKLMLLYLAILPSILLGFYIYHKDKVEKEPTSLLTKTFISGALSGVIVIAISYFYHIFQYQYDTPLKTLYYSFVLVAFIEELAKFLMFYLVCYKRREFNYQYDGVVYSCFLALGFATLENILYVFALQDFFTVVYRGILTVPAHVFFAIFMGYYFGIARHYRRYHSPRKERKFLLYSLFGPVLLHGFFDYALLSKSNLGLIFFLIFIFVLYITSFQKVRRASKEDKHI